MSETELLVHRIAPFAARIANIRAAHRTGLMTDDGTIVNQCLDLDGELERWAAEPMQKCAYITLNTMAPSENVFQGRYHVYQDSWSAHLWNSYRCIRIIVNQTLRDHLSRASSAPIAHSTRAEYQKNDQKCRDVIREISEDICSSVCFCLGKAGSGLNSSLPYHRIEDRPFSNMKAVSRFFLIWPLFLAAGAHFASTAVQHFVIHQLEGIRGTMGIQQALWLVSTIKKVKRANNLE